ncbi:MAG TPA: NAD(P)-binding protein, partial [Acidobacteriota bacterium]|nr:NAD(P)-binding protein [Acidobacteriota bacterium]
MQRERLEVDVLIVGAGPAGLTAAHVLKTRLGGETAAGLPRVLVLEKGAELGGQVLSGAVVDVSRFPAAWGDEAAWGDLLRPVIRESVWLLTSRSAYRLPWIPKALRNRECRLTSLGRLTAWMGERCEEVGVDIA